MVKSLFLLACLLGTEACRPLPERMTEWSFFVDGAGLELHEQPRLTKESVEEERRSSGDSSCMTLAGPRIRAAKAALSRFEGYMT